MPQPETDNELKPCPFCQSAEVSYRPAEYTAYIDFFCRGCGASVEYNHPKKESIRRWNDRTPVPGAIRTERTPWQGTPSIEEIEGHAKRYPAKHECGLWLRMEWPCDLSFELLKVSDGKAVQYDEDEDAWYHVLQWDDVRWHPLQPNGLPVSSGCAACAEKEGEIERLKGAAIEVIGHYDDAIDGVRAAAPQATGEPQADALTVSKRLQQIMTETEAKRGEIAALDKEFWRLKSVPESEWNPSALLVDALKEIHDT